MPNPSPMLVLSEPITGEISAPQSSIEHRDERLKESALIKQVSTPEELEIAVKVLKDLTGITKETEAARKQIKAPVIALGKKIEEVASDFVFPVEKEKARITGIVNHYQQLQLRAQEEREREAKAELKRIEDATAQAQRDLEAATTPDAKLNAQLALEEAALNTQAAESALATPTHTPRGMVTKVRYDFEITEPKKLIGFFGEYWLWKKDDEAMKFDRSGFLKALNAEPSELASFIPFETSQSATHSDMGIRIFRDVSTHVRA